MGALTRNSDLKNDYSTVRVPLAEVLPLEEVAAAYERFAAGGKLGKIVLRCA